MNNVLDEEKKDAIIQYCKFAFKQIYENSDKFTEENCQNIDSIISYLQNGNGDNWINLINFSCNTSFLIKSKIRRFNLISPSEYIMKTFNLSFSYTSDVLFRLMEVFAFKTTDVESKMKLTRSVFHIYDYNPQSFADGTTFLQIIKSACNVDISDAGNSPNSRFNFFYDFLISQDVIVFFDKKKFKNIYKSETLVLLHLGQLLDKAENLDLNISPEQVLSKLNKIIKSLLFFELFYIKKSNIFHLKPKKIIFEIDISNKTVKMTQFFENKKNLGNLYIAKANDSTLIYVDPDNPEINEIFSKDCLYQTFSMEYIQNFTISATREISIGSNDIKTVLIELLLDSFYSNDANLIQFSLSIKTPFNMEKIDLSKYSINVSNKNSKKFKLETAEKAFTIEITKTQSDIQDEMLFCGLGYLMIDNFEYCTIKKIEFLGNFDKDLNGIIKIKFVNNTDKVFPVNYYYPENLSSIKNVLCDLGTVKKNQEENFYFLGNLRPKIEHELRFSIQLPGEPVEDEYVANLPVSANVGIKPEIDIKVENRSMYINTFPEQEFIKIAIPLKFDPTTDLDQAYPDLFDQISMGAIVFVRQQKLIPCEIDETKYELNLDNFLLKVTKTARFDSAIDKEIFILTENTKKPEKNQNEINNDNENNNDESDTFDDFEIYGDLHFKEIKLENKENFRAFTIGKMKPNEQFTIISQKKIQVDISDIHFFKFILMFDSLKEFKKIPYIFKVYSSTHRIKSIKISGKSVECKNKKSVQIKMEAKQPTSEFFIEKFGEDILNQMTSIGCGYISIDQFELWPINRIEFIGQFTKFLEGKMKILFNHSPYINPHFFQANAEQKILNFQSDSNPINESEEEENFYQLLLNPEFNEHEIQFDLKLNAEMGEDGWIITFPVTHWKEISNPSFCFNIENKSILIEKYPFTESLKVLINYDITPQALIGQWTNLFDNINSFYAVYFDKFDLVPCSLISSTIEINVHEKKYKTSKVFKITSMNKKNVYILINPDSHITLKRNDVKMDLEGFPFDVYSIGCFSTENEINFVCYNDLNINDDLLKSASFTIKNDILKTPDFNNQVTIRIQSDFAMESIQFSDLNFDFEAAFNYDFEAEIENEEVDVILYRETRNIMDEFINKDLGYFTIENHDVAEMKSIDIIGNFNDGQFEGKIEYKLEGTELEEDIYFHSGSNSLHLTNLQIDSSKVKSSDDYRSFNIGKLKQIIIDDNDNNIEQDYYEIEEEDEEEKMIENENQEDNKINLFDGINQNENQEDNKVNLFDGINQNENQEDNKINLFDGINQNENQEDNKVNLFDGISENEDDSYKSDDIDSDVDKADNNIKILDNSEDEIKINNSENKDKIIIMSNSDSEEEKTDEQTEQENKYLLPIGFLQNEEESLLNEIVSLSIEDRVSIVLDEFLENINENKEEEEENTNDIQNQNEKENIFNFEENDSLQPPNNSIIKNKKKVKKSRKSNRKNDGNENIENNNKKCHTISFDFTFDAELIDNSWEIKFPITRYKTLNDPTFHFEITNKSIVVNSLPSRFVHVKIPINNDPNILLKNWKKVFTCIHFGYAIVFHQMEILPCIETEIGFLEANLKENTIVMKRNFKLPIESKKEVFIIASKDVEVSYPFQINQINVKGIPYNVFSIGNQIATKRIQILFHRKNFITNYSVKSNSFVIGHDLVKETDSNPNALQISFHIISPFNLINIQFDDDEIENDIDTDIFEKVLDVQNEETNVTFYNIKDDESDYFDLVNFGYFTIGENYKILGVYDIKIKSKFTYGELEGEMTFIIGDSQYEDSIYYHEKPSKIQIINIYIDDEVIEFEKAIKSNENLFNLGCFKEKTEKHVVTITFIFESELVDNSWIIHFPVTRLKDKSKNPPYLFEIENEDIKIEEIPYDSDYLDIDIPIPDEPEKNLKEWTNIYSTISLGQACFFYQSEVHRCELKRTLIEIDLTKSVIHCTKLFHFPDGFGTRRIYFLISKEMKVENSEKDLFKLIEADEYPYNIFLVGFVEPGYEFQLRTLQTIEISDIFIYKKSLVMKNDVIRSDFKQKDSSAKRKKGKRKIKKGEPSPSLIFIHVDANFAISSVECLGQTLKNKNLNNFFNFSIETNKKEIEVVVTKIFDDFISKLNKSDLGYFTISNFDLLMIKEINVHGNFDNGLLTGELEFKVEGIQFDEDILYHPGSNSVALSNLRIDSDILIVEEEEEPDFNESATNINIETETSDNKPINIGKLKLLEKENENHEGNKKDQNENENQDENEDHKENKKDKDKSENEDEDHEENKKDKDKSANEDEDQKLNKKGKDESENEDEYHKENKEDKDESENEDNEENKKDKDENKNLNDDAPIIPINDNYSKRYHSVAFDFIYKAEMAEETWEIDFPITRYNTKENPSFFFEIDDPLIQIDELPKDSVRLSIPINNDPKIIFKKWRALFKCIHFGYAVYIHQMKLIPCTELEKSYMEANLNDNTIYMERKFSPPEKPDKIVYIITAKEITVKNENMPKLIQIDVEGIPFNVYSIGKKPFTKDFQIKFYNDLVVNNDSIKCSIFTFGNDLFIDGISNPNALQSNLQVISPFEHYEIQIDDKEIGDLIDVENTQTKVTVHNVIRSGIEQLDLKDFGFFTIDQEFKLLNTKRIEVISNFNYGTLEGEITYFVEDCRYEETIYYHEKPSKIVLSNLRVDDESIEIQKTSKLGENLIDIGAFKNESSDHIINFSFTFESEIIHNSFNILFPITRFFDEDNNPPFLFEIENENIEINKIPYDSDYLDIDIPIPDDPEKNLKEWTNVYSAISLGQACFFYQSEVHRCELKRTSFEIDLTKSVIHCTKQFYLPNGFGSKQIYFLISKEMKVENSNKADFQKLNSDEYPFNIYQIGIIDSGKNFKLKTSQKIKIKNLSVSRSSFSFLNDVISSEYESENNEAKKPSSASKISVHAISNESIGSFEMLGNSFENDEISNEMKFEFETNEKEINVVFRKGFKEFLSKIQMSSLGYFTVDDYELLMIKDINVQSVFEKGILSGEIEFKTNGTENKDTIYYYFGLKSLELADLRVDSIPIDFNYEENTAHKKINIGILPINEEDPQMLHTVNFSFQLKAEVNGENWEITFPITRYNEEETGENPTFLFEEINEGIHYDTLPMDNLFLSFKLIPDPHILLSLVDYDYSTTFSLYYLNHLKMEECKLYNTFVDVDLMTCSLSSSYSFEIANPSQNEQEIFLLTKLSEEEITKIIKVDPDMHPIEKYEIEDKKDFNAFYIGERNSSSTFSLTLVKDIEIREISIKNVEFDFQIESASTFSMKITSDFSMSQIELIGADLKFPCFNKKMIEINDQFLNPNNIVCDIEKAKANIIDGIHYSNLGYFTIEEFCLLPIEKIEFIGESDAELKGNVTFTLRNNYYYDIDVFYWPPPFVKSIVVDSFPIDIDSAKYKELPKFGVGEVHTVTFEISIQQKIIEEDDYKEETEEAENEEKKIEKDYIYQFPLTYFLSIQNPEFWFEISNKDIKIDQLPDAPYLDISMIATDLNLLPFGPDTLINMMNIVYMQGNHDFIGLLARRSFKASVEEMKAVITCESIYYNPSDFPVRYKIVFPIDFFDFIMSIRVNDKNSYSKEEFVKMNENNKYLFLNKDRKIQSKGKMKIVFTFTTKVEDDVKASKIIIRNEPLTINHVYLPDIENEEDFLKELKKIVKFKFTNPESQLISYGDIPDDFTQTSLEAKFLFALDNKVLIQEISQCMNGTMLFQLRQKNSYFIFKAKEVQYKCEVTLGENKADQKVIMKYKSPLDLSLKCLHCIYNNPRSHISIDGGYAQASLLTKDENYICFPADDIDQDKEGVYSFSQSLIMTKDGTSSKYTCMIPCDANTELIINLKKLSIAKIVKYKPEFLEKNEGKNGISLSGFIKTSTNLKLKIYYEPTLLESLKIVCKKPKELGSISQSVLKSYSNLAPVFSRSNELKDKIDTAITGFLNSFNIERNINNPEKDNPFFEQLIKDYSDFAKSLNILAEQGKDSSNATLDLEIAMFNYSFNILKIQMKQNVLDRAVVLPIYESCNDIQKRKNELYLDLVCPMNISKHQIIPYLALKINRRVIYISMDYKIRNILKKKLSPFTKVFTDDKKSILNYNGDTMFAIFKPFELFGLLKQLSKEDLQNLILNTLVVFDDYYHYSPPLYLLVKILIDSIISIRNSSKFTEDEINKTKILRVACAEIPKINEDKFTKQDGIAYSTINNTFKKRKNNDVLMNVKVPYSMDVQYIKTRTGKSQTDFLEESINDKVENSLNGKNNYPIIIRLPSSDIVGDVKSFIQKSIDLDEEDDDNY